MRGLVFTVDAVLALSVLAAALLIANAFSNTVSYDSLHMHIAARDYVDLTSKGIEVPQEKLSFPVTLDKSEVTGGVVVTSAIKQYYSPCGCETTECNLVGDSACLEEQGEIKTLQAWSAK